MASSSYGVTSAGFIRQTEAEIVKEIIDCFPQDLNFIKGDFETNLLEAMTKIRLRWQENDECNFNAQNNYCLATGCQLDNAIEVMGYKRLDGEIDADLIARVKLAEQNDGGGAEVVLERKLRQIEDVCRVKIYLPKDRLKTGHEACDYEVVVQGGDKETIAKTILSCSSGLTAVGTTTCRFEEDKNGVCREVSFTPATVQDYCVRIFMRTFGTNCGCDGQTFASIQKTVFDLINSKDICNGIGIGGTIRAGMIQIPGVEITEIQFAPAIYDDDGNCACDDHDESQWIDGPFTLDCRTVMNIPSLECICPIALPGSV